MHCMIIEIFCELLSCAGGRGGVGHAHCRLMLPLLFAVRITNHVQTKHLSPCTTAATPHLPVSPSPCPLGLNKYLHISSARADRTVDQRERLNRASCASPKPQANQRVQRINQQSSKVSQQLTKNHTHTHIHTHTNALTHAHSFMRFILLAKWGLW